MTDPLAAAAFARTTTKAMDNYVAASTPLAVKRILACAAKGLSPIKGVLAASPTYAQTASGSVSPITGNTLSNAGATPGVSLDYPYFGINNARYMTPIGGPLTAVTGTRSRPATYSDIPAQNRRLSGHGSGISFATYSDKVGIVADFRGSGFTVYVTDPVTRVRARVQANDYAPTSGLTEHGLTFASRGLRLIEVYGVDVSTYYCGINVPLTDSVWAVSPGAGQARYAVLWDSWGDGQGNGATNRAKLAITDFMGERLGVNNIISCSVGGTGFVSDNSAAGVTFPTRVANGDIDLSRIGRLDAVMVGGSLNDYVLGGNTAAATQAAVLTTLQNIRKAQPNAVICLWGPQFTTSTGQPTQAWYDAHAAAFAAFADPNSVYLDNSATGANWMFNTSITGTATGINTVIFTGTQNHVNDAGMAYVGDRIADSFINALLAKWS